MTSFGKDQEIEYAKMDLEELENIERNMIEDNNYMQAMKIDKLLDKFRSEITTFVDGYASAAKQGSKPFVRSEEMFRKMLDIYSLCAHDLIIQLNKLNLYTLSGILQKIVFGMKLFSTGLMKFQIEFITSYARNFEAEFLRTHAGQVTANPSVKVTRANTMSFNDMKQNNLSVHKNLDQNVVFSVTSNIDAINALLTETHASNDAEDMSPRKAVEQRKLMSDVLEREINKEMEEQNKILEEMNSILGAKKEQDRASYSGLSKELRGILRSKKGNLIEEEEEVVKARKKKKERIIYEEEEEEEKIPEELKAAGNEDKLRKWIEMRQKRWHVETKNCATEPDREIFDIAIINDLKVQVIELEEKLSEIFLENQTMVNKMNAILEENTRYKLREYELFKNNEDLKKAHSELKVSESELDFTLNQLKKEANALKIDMGHLESKLEKTKDKKRRYKHEKIQLKTWLDEAVREKEHMKQSTQDSETLLHDLKKKYSDQALEISEKSEQLKSVQEAYEVAAASLEESEEKEERAQIRIQELESQLASQAREKEVFIDQVKKEKNKDSSKEDLVIAKKELENANFSNERLKAEVKLLEKERTVSKSEIETLKKSYNILKENFEKLKAEKAAESRAGYKNSVALASGQQPQPQSQQHPLDSKKNSVVPSPKNNMIGNNNINLSNLDDSSGEGLGTPRANLNKKMSVNTNSPKASASKFLAASSPTNNKKSIASVVSSGFARNMSKAVSEQILEDESEKSEEESKAPQKEDNATQTDWEQDFESTLERFLVSMKLDPALSKHVLKYIKDIKVQGIKGEQNKFNAAKQFEDLLGNNSVNKRGQDGAGNLNISASTIAENSENPLLYSIDKGIKKPSFTKSEIKSLITPTKGSSLGSLASLVSPSKGFNEGFKFNLTFANQINAGGGKKNMKNNSIDQSNLSSVASLDAELVSLDYKREKRRKENPSPTNITQILMNSDEESTEEEKDEIIKGMFESFENRVTEKKNQNKDIKKLVEYIRRTDNSDSELPSFQDFRNYVVRLFLVHKKCGKECMHLKRFYQKIGYSHSNQPQGFLSRRKTLALTKTEISSVPLSIGAIARLPEIVSFRKPENRRKKAMNFKEYI